MINISAKVAIDFGIGGEDDLGVLESNSLGIFMETLYWRFRLESIRQSERKRSYRARIFPQDSWFCTHARQYQDAPAALFPSLSEMFEKCLNSN